MAFGLSPLAQADESDLLVVARQTAKMAGGAKFCQADEDMIDEFIAKAEARLAFLAKDEYEKVMGKLEFKNVFAGAAAKEPELGCEAFVTQFERTVKDTR